MIKIKKGQINSVLSTISAFDSKTGVPVFGLLYEQVPLSLKRRLQRIHKELIEHYNQMREDITTIDKEHEGKETHHKEIELLLDEDVTVNAEHIELSMLDSVVTAHNYSYEVLELIGK